MKKQLSLPTQAEADFNILGIKFRNFSFYSHSRIKIFICLLCAVLIFGLFAFNTKAQVKLVTVPGRDAVSITIYKNHDLTLVKEQRSITLKKGINTIQFNWTDTLIDPTSLQLKPMAHPDEVTIKASIFPPHQKNVILWKVDATESIEEKFEVSYFISGLRWNANYIAISDPSEEHVSLKGYITVSNNSGEDFEDAETRLVVGEIHLVEEIREAIEKYGIEEAKKQVRETAELMRAAGRPKPKARMPVRKPLLPAVEKEAVSEYYIYTLEGKETIKNKWQKRLLSLEAIEIPVEVFYKYRGNVRRYYRFVNDSEHKLGKEPLPVGEIQMFNLDELGNLSHIGQTRLDFTPVDSKVELDLGGEPEVKVKRKLMDFVRINLRFNKEDKLVAFDTEQEVEFEIHNYKPKAIKLEVYEHIEGQWEIIFSSHDYTREDVHTIKFVVELEADSEDRIKYRARILRR